MIRRSWPLAIAAALIVGCNTEPEQAENFPEAGKGGPAPSQYDPADKGDETVPGKSDKPDASYPDPVTDFSGPPPTGAEANKDTERMPGDPVETPGTPDESPAVPADTETPGEAPQASVTLSEEEIANIEKLPADEASLALAQQVCPVSGEHLGEMGKPIKVSADGETAFLCCEGCKPDFEATPAEFLAKIGKDKE